MVPTSTTPAADAKSADTPRARRFRLAGILVLAGAVGVVGWLSLRSRPGAGDPAAVYDYVRDRVLAGDGDALWPVLLPTARTKYVSYIREMGKQGDENTGAAAWRRSVGLSKSDLETLPPSKVMAREYLAHAEDMLRGSRVHRTDVWDENTCLLNIVLRNGSESQWVVRRVDGAWKVGDLAPAITLTGMYNEGPGIRSVKVPMPKDEKPGGR